ncbi:hypothetical protein BKA70DRAFT_1223942 [Coprinopsis sp. MPI-PUGE-AT-0042]|nr:hypothetical protein BKA70DRAFT_1223942 [Coprinopsis sp. MPI-PUGE-AT-0042]
MRWLRLSVVPLRLTTLLTLSSTSRIPFRRVAAEPQRHLEERSCSLCRSESTRISIVVIAHSRGPTLVDTVVAKVHIMVLRDFWSVAQVWPYQREAEQAGANEDDRNRWSDSSSLSGSLVNQSPQEWDDCDRLDQWMLLDRSTVISTASSSTSVSEAERPSSALKVSEDAPTTRWKPPSLPYILASSQLADLSAIENLSTERIKEILYQHSRAMVAYHVALEFERVASEVLSRMRDQKDLLFGEGMWLLRHIDTLEESHRQTANRASGAEKWDEAYQEQWRSVAEKLLLSVEPCSFHDLL